MWSIPNESPETRLYAATAAALLLDVSALLIISLRIVFFRILTVTMEKAKVVKMRSRMTNTVSLSLMLRNIAKPQDILVQKYLSKINAKEYLYFFIIRFNILENVCFFLWPNFVDNWKFFQNGNIGGVGTLFV
jgi:hypothetical protein